MPFGPAGSWCPICNPYGNQFSKETESTKEPTNYAKQVESSLQRESDTMMDFLRVLNRHDIPIKSLPRIVQHLLDFVKDLQ